MANENRTQDAVHALLHQSRNSKVRKNPDAIAPFGWILGIGYERREGVAFRGRGPRDYLQKTSAALYRIHVHINFRHFYTFLSLLRRTVSVSKLINRYDQDYMRDPDK